ncbi:MAG TPA: hypothetical protein VLQ94_04560 [Candidatus Binatia bacterium]|nr:hypothetical protein [Candidatus Binatia bacterium]
MTLHPAVLALFVASLLTGCMVLYAGWYGARILLQWEIGSGSERQLELERRTYLISTLLSVAFAVQLLSLFLFVFTADRLHGMFSGAMCAAGTLNVNRFGYPVLILKIVTFLLAGLWLVVNHADTRGYDYPLIKSKYALLLVLGPLVLAEGYLQYRYFAALRPDVITSCCGSLFGQGGKGIAADLAALPAGPMNVAFFGGMAATLACGIRFRRTGRGGYLFSVASGVTFAVALASIISFICLYIYELPTHHCPFCILKKEYGYVGYVLYIALFGGGVAGIGAGVLMPFRGRGSMVRVIPPLQRRLTEATLVLYLLFTLVVSYRILFSPFRLHYLGMP